MLKVPLATLGNTGLKVSKLGFGTFDFGVPALNISSEMGGQILIESHKLGINFWDTAIDYGSHPHVASALNHLPREDVVISTKAYAESFREVKKNLKSALKELNTDYIDIFLLHYVKHGEVEKCRQILRELNDIKTTGTVKAIGLSTHSVAVVKEASLFEDVDVIMPIYCKASQELVSKFRKRIPLEDGSIDEMSNAIKLAHHNGKGVIAMKVLGSGASPLIKDYQLAIKAILQLDFIDAMVIGMQNFEEVKKNVEAIISS